MEENSSCSSISSAVFPVHRQSSVKETFSTIKSFSVDILLKPTGNAPIMKKKKWTVDSDKPIGWIIEFMKKYLKLDSNEKLFLYVNQTFAPSPDQMVRNLFDCYSTEGKLVLHYCKTQAWG
ncbi:autophagy protein 12-like isoform X2 [Anthonomus grandis grandis]|uniref:autophagy protein 12-like isoform X2 n=1 Tax=Anthonomus grandis grandis TaxID=2921223 RepID=UPI0021662883|nr:autophagy protein 12-like isoform X2 [Anthonomus grandis grandis]